MLHDPYHLPPDVVNWRINRPHNQISELLTSKIFQYVGIYKNRPPLTYYLTMGGSWPIFNNLSKKKKKKGLKTPQNKFLMQTCRPAPGGRHVFENLPPGPP